MPDSWWGYVIALAALTGPISGALAWAAKLWWSREFAAAKDETIKAKDSQIALLQAQITSLTNNHNELVRTKEAHIVLLERKIRGLQELNPMKLREYTSAIRQGLEEYNDLLKQEVKDKDSAIQELITKGQQNSIAYGQLKQERDNFKIQLTYLQQQMGLSNRELFHKIAAATTDPRTTAAIFSMTAPHRNYNRHPNHIYSLLNNSSSFFQGFGNVVAPPQPGEVTEVLLESDSKSPDPKSKTGSEGSASYNASDK